MQPVLHRLNTDYAIGSVNCYSLDSADGLILIDCGVPNEETKRYYLESFDLSRLCHILVTHSHNDHYGLAAWLAARSGARVYFPYRDYLKARQRDDYLRLLGDIMQGMGFSNRYYQRLLAIIVDPGNFSSFPEDITVVEQDFPSNIGLDFIACPGHSQSDLVYLTGDFAITGDTLLRGVFQTPVLEVDMINGGRFNNYEAYCQSLAKLAALEGRRILPGHGETLENVRDAQFFYVSKLLQRAERLRPWRKEANISNIISEMFTGGMTETFYVFLKAAELLFTQDFFREPDLLAVSLRQIDLYDEVKELFDRALGRKTAIPTR
ncbi:MAG: MBL fold metallo-hydrolase [Desulfobulbaceae bacterium]|jgi:2,4-dienoyl-CoA reductase (NADPH2)|nr:MBL fold metallo-hydrolase [Desulfobulbaceae bacterium]